MSNEASIWNKVMGAALAMPGVKVDREDFLKKELQSYCSQEQLKHAIAGKPIDGVSQEVINRIADACINSHTTRVTLISTAMGMPGGLTVGATIPADIAQYYWHVFVLAQKLAYLYGFPDLQDEEGKLTDTAIDMLTLFVGVMMGASAANAAIQGVALELSKQVAKRLPQQALTKTVYYPIVKQIAKWLGVKLTKNSFAKGVGKMIPLVGGFLSGGITLATFRPSAKRLQHHLQKVMFEMSGTKESYHDDNIAEQYANFEDITDDPIRENDQTASKEMLSLMVLINAARIDHNFTEAKRNFINDEIKNSSLPEEEMLSLIDSYNAGQTFQVNLNVFKEDDLYAVVLVKKLICLYKLDEKISFTEKIYLRKIVRELGYTPEDIQDLINIAE